MRDWRDYAIKSFKPEEFYTVPEEFRLLHDHCFERFCTYNRFLTDTMVQFGSISSCCLSLLFRPKIVVEFGVKVGWTSLLLCKFNPKARVHGVDLYGRVYDTCLPTGYAVLMHEVKNYSLHLMNSWDFSLPGQVDLCFIDAEHTKPSVELDTWRAWENRNKEGEWCIAWDDYHPTNADVLNTVNDFVKEVGYPLQKIGSWYWIGSKEVPEEELSKIQPTEEDLCS